MKKILQFLAGDGAFLYEKHSYRIVDSRFIDTFGGTGSITLRNDVAELRLELERDRIFTDMRSIESKQTSPWYSMDILKQLITGKQSETAELNSENLAFLMTNFNEIQDLFSKTNLPATELTGNRLKKERTRRMFG